MSQDLPDQVEPPLPESMFAAITRTIRYDARGPSEDAIERARQLARLLPAPINGGWRAWFDRAAALIGTPIAPPSALVGVRRTSGPDVLEWSSPVARVEIEIDPPKSGSPFAVTLQGHVETSGEHPRQACPVAAIAADGTVLACAMIESTGYFSLEAPGAVGHLALALPGGTLILEFPRAEAGQSGSQGAAED